jgi:hypothetical protein
LSCAFTPTKRCEIVFGAWCASRSGRVRRAAGSPDESFDFLRHRRREQQVLPLLRQTHEDAPDLRHEAHVQHAVGFVEHDHLHLLERQVAAFEVIDEAARAGDDDVDTALERGFLDRQVDAAECGAHVQARVARVGAQVLGDLHAQVRASARGSRRAGPVRRRRAIEHRQAEGGGLAAAGLAEADQVTAGEDLRDGSAWMSVGVS